MILIADIGGTNARFALVEDGAYRHNNRFGQYLADMPTYVITSKYPALIGSAVATGAHYSHLGISGVA